MRADRLLAMLMILQDRSMVTARELAARLEVSERTVHRDVIALSIAGVPVYTLRGPGGGIALVEEYRSDLTGLTKNEVRALFMMSVPQALIELGLDQELRAAFLKLAAGLPSTLREDEKEVRQRIHIDPTPWERRPLLEDATLLMNLQSAVWESQSLEIRYRSWMRPDLSAIKAVFHPYGLVSKGGRWYLVGRRMDHMAVVRVDLVEEVRQVGSSFERPKAFDLVAYWQKYCQAQNKNRPKYPVLATVDEALLPLLPWYLGNDLPFSIVGGKKTEDSPGSSSGTYGRVNIVITFEFFEQALRALLAMGRAVEIIEPIALRVSIIDYAEQILSVYKS